MSNVIPVFKFFSQFALVAPPAICSQGLIQADGYTSAFSSLDFELLYQVSRLEEPKDRCWPGLRCIRQNNTESQDWTAGKL